jgi:hypothetical protein
MTMPAQNLDEPSFLHVSVMLSEVVQRKLRAGHYSLRTEEAGVELRIGPRLPSFP